MGSVNCDQRRLATAEVQSISAIALKITKSERNCLPFRATVLSKVCFFMASI